MLTVVFNPDSTMWFVALKTVEDGKPKLTKVGEEEYVTHEEANAQLQKIHAFNN